MPHERPRPSSLPERIGRQRVALLEIGSRRTLENVAPMNVWMRESLNGSSAPSSRPVWQRGFTALLPLFRLSNYRAHRNRPREPSLAQCNEAYVPRQVLNFLSIEQQASASAPLIALARAGYECSNLASWPCLGALTICRSNLVVCPGMLSRTNTNKSCCFRRRTRPRARPEHRLVKRWRRTAATPVPRRSASLAQQDRHVEHFGDDLPCECDSRVDSWSRTT